MSADHDPVDELLASIADDTRTDWASVDRAAAGSASRGRLDALRDVARIAEFERSRQRESTAPEGGLGAPGAPTRWGDLLLLERLSEGLHAEVHRAWDPRLEREVALKRMRAGDHDEALLAEARAAARVRHPHVVVVHGVDRHEGRVGLWMELVRGLTLEQEVRLRGPLDAATARRLGLEIGAALVAVHTAGLLHRDVKPANVIRDAEGRFVLADFGLGLRFAAPGEGAGAGAAAAASRHVSGTPMYMAPEALAGAAASERTDLYALGMLLWFALSGRPPFAVDTLAALAAAANTGPSPGLRELRPDVPATLVDVVERAIAPRPEDRFASARALVEALEAVSAPAAAVSAAAVSAAAVPAAAPAVPAPAASAAPAARGKRLAIAVAGLAVLAVVAVLLLRRGDGDGERTSVAPPTVAPAPGLAPAPVAYDVEASFLRRDATRAARLVAGDRVRPGDRLSLEVRATRRAWVYVLNEDERGERYLLFPQPGLGAQNPLAADSTFVLPGLVAGSEHAWTVTSAGGREHFLVVVSPEPVEEIEKDLGRFEAPARGRAVRYARVGEPALERLRGVGGLEPLPPDASPPPARGTAGAFDRFRALAGRESGVRGVWVRQVVFENPR